MGGRGQLSGFTASPNFPLERAKSIYNDAIDAGFTKQEAMDRVKGTQYVVEHQVYKGNKRDVTSETYERERRRNQRQVDALYKGR